MKWLVSQGHSWQGSFCGNTDTVWGTALRKKKGCFVGLRGEKG